LTTPAPLQFEPWFVARHPEVRLAGARAVLELAEGGATVPFIARYRKERTGNLDEVAIRATLRAKEQWDRLENRKTIVLESIERQKKLTPELRERILASEDMDTLEDLYLPYKQKRKSKALLAREAGLEPLADWIWNCGHGTETPQPGQTLELWAFTFRNAEKGFPDAAAAIAGARDILVERIAETAELRARVRAAVMDQGWIRSVKAAKAKPHSKYETYFAFQERLATLREPQNSHRYLALRRGAAEDELRLSLGGPPGDETFEERLLEEFERAALTVRDSPGAETLKAAARTAFKEHVWPSMENEAHRALKEAADEAAIRVFAENVRRLLLDAPFGPRAVLGVDPGVRTGSKLAAVDAKGGFVKSEVLRLQTDEQKAQAKATLVALARESSAEAVAVGNGTGSRETEVFARQTLLAEGLAVPVVLVSEAGASVYSASDAARDELPDLDVTVRGAVTIARRLQDPLAELVKTEPRSLGVGQYQHDVAPHALETSLGDVVDSCVNSVGVDLNTASRHLLTHVSGIGPALAEAIVSHRQEKGLFASRQALLDVPRFGTKAFEQAAGFLRVPASANPLDNTGVHPERYGALEGLAQKLGRKVEELLGPGVALVREAATLKDELGEWTFEDVLRELEKPGRDPRASFTPFAFREDVRTLEDLKPGMTCPGIVTNVTNFGAFVDVGVHHDGLVHISQLGDHFVKDPRTAVKPGDRVEVRVLKVDLEKRQISLTMRKAQPDRRKPRPKEARPPRAAPARPHSARPNRPVPPSGPPKGRGPSPERPNPPRDAKPGREAKPGRDATTGRDAKPGSRPPAPKPAPPPPRPKPAFNNPFAVLARLKDPGKS
jgi:protein Tex